MSAQKRARDDEPAGAAAGGAGGPPPPLPPETLAILLLSRDVGFGDEPLSLVVAFLAPRDQCRLAATCRATWRCVPAGLSAADADRVRCDHPLWQAIIDDCVNEQTRLHWAAHRGDLARVRELCDWHADVEARDGLGWSALHHSSNAGHAECARELISRGADIEAENEDGCTPLMWACVEGRVDACRLLLAAGADKRRCDNGGQNAYAFAGFNNPEQREAIIALLDAAP